MSFFSSLFKKKSPTPRQLSHPSELMVGDIIMLDNDSALPDPLQAKQFKVSAVHSLDFHGDREFEFKLVGQSEMPIYLSVNRDSGRVGFSIELNRAQVEALFDIEVFAQTFDDEQPPLLIAKTHVLTMFSPWLSNTPYHRINFAEEGHFFNGDLRNQKIDQSLPFAHYQWRNIEDTHSVDVAVYETEETKVAITCYFNLAVIKEFWPA